MNAHSVKGDRRGYRPSNGVVIEGGYRRQSRLPEWAPWFAAIVVACVLPFAFIVGLFFLAGGA